MNNKIIKGLRKVENKFKSEDYGDRIKAYKLFNKLCTKYGYTNVQILREKHFSF